MEILIFAGRTHQLRYGRFGSLAERAQNSGRITAQHGLVICQAHRQGGHRHFCMFRDRLKGGDRVRTEETVFVPQTLNNRRDCLLGSIAARLGMAGEASAPIAVKASWAASRTGWLVLYRSRTQSLNVLPW